MAKVIITPTLEEEVLKKFRREAVKVFRLMQTLETTPKKGKILTSVAGYVIKEIKYGKWRFYCVTDGFVLKFGTESQLHELLIKFVRMSDKKQQQETIDSIKDALEAFGFNL